MARLNVVDEYRACARRRASIITALEGAFAGLVLAALLFLLFV